MERLMVLLPKDGKVLQDGEVQTIDKAAYQDDVYMVNQHWWKELFCKKMHTTD